MGAVLASPAVIPQPVIEQVGNDLAAMQMAWQRGEHPGVSEAHLVRTLNNRVELASGPSYLGVKPREVRRIRTELWMKLPALSTGLKRRRTNANGRQLFTRVMSPFEAFLVADWVLYQKLTDNDFVLTNEEHSASRGKRKPPRQAGLSSRPINPRREQFEAHLRTMAATKWQSASAIVQIVTDLVGGR